MKHVNKLNRLLVRQDDDDPEEAFNEWDIIMSIGGAIIGGIAMFTG